MKSISMAATFEKFKELKMKNYYWVILSIAVSLLIGTLSIRPAIISFQIKKEAKQFRKRQCPFDMIQIEGGTFSMGSEENNYKHEMPKHQIVVDDFYMGKTEVTQSQWVSIMKYNLSTIKGSKIQITYRS